MNAFIRRNLDPASRLGEILFGLIMALGITGSVRLEREDMSNRELFIAILGCNLAWAIVDGVMFALTALFERGRKARLVASVLAAPSEDAALERIGKELDDRIESITTDDERQQLYRSVLVLLRRSKREPPAIRRDDLLGGVAVALLILMATMPLLVPLLVVPDTNLAVRLSNTIALTQLCLLGAWWARVVGASPWRLAAGLTLLGLVLVGITIALGG